MRRQVVLLGLACSGAFLVEGGIENWSAIFMERDLGASPLVSALGPSSYALAMITGRLSGQWLTGRISACSVRSGPRPRRPGLEPVRRIRVPS